MLVEKKEPAGAKTPVNNVRRGVQGTVAIQGSFINAASTACRNPQVISGTMPKALSIEAENRARG